VARLALAQLSSSLVYTELMQLHTARLCLDCEEVHDSQQCPVCASETFAYITRWVPAPERRRRPRPTTSPEAEVYSQLVNPPPPAPSQGRRLLKQGMIGLTAVGLASWLWRHRKGLPMDRPLGISPRATMAQDGDPKEPFGV
jgi:hypothetical protein